MVNPSTLGTRATSASAVAKDFIVVKMSGTVYVEGMTKFLKKKLGEKLIRTTACPILNSEPIYGITP